MSEPDEDEPDEEDGQDAAVDPRERLPTMTGRRDLEMDAIGWLIFASLLILMIPLLPAVVLAIILTKLLGLTGRDRLSWPRAHA